MREIKFRGKMPNGAWVYGSFWDDAVYPDIIDEYTNHRLVDRETVGQFTTQTDNNGEDIYEGDILRVGSQVGTVVYDCDCFEVAFGGGNTSLFRCLLEKPCLVIGNIYDNSDLLEADHARD